MGMQTTKQRHKLARYITLTLLTGMLVSTTAYALPQNGQVAAGSGSITQNGATMTVQQNTARMGVNWQSFNIAKSETVNFRQPNASSVALNRVLGNDASAIYGSLNANGKVFLVNPNGVMFAPGASVNVGGIVASTKDISDANFMAGKYNFAGSSTAGVTNQGSINVADGGYVALLANNVTNAGTITAPKGSVALGAGNAFTLSTDGTGKVNLAVDEAAVNAAAVNKGTIKADGGYVVMKATDAAGVLNSVVTNTGVIEARSLKNDKGEIVLDGGSQGIVNVGGKLDTSAAEANTAAGNLTVKGQYTNINAGAELYAKATGTQTGGTIETSGDALYVDPTATINAASEKGMGGSWTLDPLYVVIGDDSGNAWNSPTSLPADVTYNSTTNTYKNGASSARTTVICRHLPLVLR
jgi:filamentous hemagglutinin family protein